MSAVSKYTDMSAPQAQLWAFWLESMDKAQSVVCLIDAVYEKAEAGNGIPDDTPLCTLLSAMFDCLTPEHGKAVEDTIVSIISLAIDELESLPVGIMDTVLLRLTAAQRSRAPRAYDMAMEILRTLSDRMEDAIYQLTTAVLQGSPNAAGSELLDRDKLYDVIFEANAAAPSMLNRIMALLGEEVRCDDANSRLDTTVLLGDLFAHPAAEHWSAHRTTLDVLISRHVDTDARVRQATATAAAAIMKAHPATIPLWSKALVSCLRSPDAAVRKAAVVTVSNVAVEAVENMPDELVRELGARVQDKDADVARDSTTGLAQIYSGRLKYLWSAEGDSGSPSAAAGAAVEATQAADAACMRSLITAAEADRAAALSEMGLDADGDAKLSDAAVTAPGCARADVMQKLHWIPEVILNSYTQQGRDRDLHLRLVQVLDALILPLHVHPAARARAFVQLFASLSEEAREKLAVLMRERAHMQTLVSAAVSQASDKQAVQEAVKGLLPMFGGAKAANEAAITRVLTHADKRIRSRMLQAADPTSSTETLNEAKGDLFGRLAKSSAEGKMAKAMWRLTAMNMVNADMLPQLVRLAQLGNQMLESDGVFEWGSGDGPVAALGALQVVAQCHPGCFIPHSQEGAASAKAMLQLHLAPLFEIAAQGHPAAAIACLRVLRDCGSSVPAAFLNAHGALLLAACAGGAHKSARVAKSAMQAMCSMAHTGSPDGEFSHLFDEAAMGLQSRPSGADAFVALEMLAAQQVEADAAAAAGQTKSKRSKSSSQQVTAESDADGGVWLHSVAALRAAAELAHLAPHIFEATLGVALFQSTMDDVVKSELAPAAAPSRSGTSSRKRRAEADTEGPSRASAFVDGRDAGSIVSDCPKWPSLGSTEQVPGVSLSTAARVAGLALLVNCVRGAWACGGLPVIHGKQCKYPMQRVVKLLVSILKSQGVMWETDGDSAAGSPDAIALRMAAIRGLCKLAQLSTAAPLLQHLQVCNAMLACPAVLQTLSTVVCEDADLVVRQSLVQSLGKALSKGKSACALLVPLAIACGDHQKIVAGAARDALENGIDALQKTHARAAAAAAGTAAAEKTSMRLAAWLLPQYSVFALLHTMAAVCSMPHSLEYLGNGNAGDYVEMFGSQLSVLKLALLPMCEAQNAATDGTPFLLAVLSALQRPNVVDATGSESASALVTRVLAALAHGLVRGAIRRDEQATAFTGNWHLPAAFFKLSQHAASSSHANEKLKASLSAASTAGSQFRGATRSRAAARTAAVGTPRSATPKRTPGSKKRPSSARESAQRSAQRRVPLQETGTNSNAASPASTKPARRSGRSRGAVRSLAE